MSMSRSWFVLGSGIAAAQPMASESRATLLIENMICEPCLWLGPATRVLELCRGMRWIRDRMTRGATTTPPVGLCIS